MIPVNSPSAAVGPHTVLPTAASERARPGQEPGKQEDPKVGAGRAAGESVNLGSSVQSKYDTPEQVLKNFDPQTVVKNVTSVLEQAIKRAAANGASAEELEKMQSAAQKGIDKGFGEAQEIIKGLGLMSDELTVRIDEARDGIHDRLGEFTQQLINGGGSSGVASTADVSSVRAGYREQNNFSFSVTTAEGDVVTVAAAQQQSTQLEALERQSEDARELMVRWQDARSDSFTFTVEGDLNEEELGALESLMAKVGAVADKFFGGQYEAAFEKTKQLQLEDEALVSMSLNMTQKTLAVAEYSSMASGESTRAKSSNDWILPIKQYAQALGDLQRSQSGLLGSTTWLDMLSAHPAQKTSMVDFASSMMRRLSA